MKGTKEEKEKVTRRLIQWWWSSMGSEKKEKIKGREREREQTVCVSVSTSQLAWMCVYVSRKSEREREWALKEKKPSRQMKQTRISLAIGENGKFSCAVLSGAVFYCCAAVATNCANVFECVPLFLLLPIFLFQHPSPFCYTFWRSSFVLQFALSLRSPPTQLPTLPPLCGTQTRTFKEGKK